MATVTAQGVVTIVAAGSALLVAEQAAQGEFGAGSTQVELVVNKALPTLTWSPQTLRLGGPSLTLTPPVSNNPIGGFTYNVADASVVTVNGDMLTALRVDTTSLTAIQAETANFLSGSISVPLTVDKAQIAITGLSELTRTIDPVNAANNQFTLQAQATPPDGSTPVFQYSSNAPAVATVSGNTVTVVGVGDAQLTATLQEGASHASTSTTVALHVLGADPGLALGALWRSLTEPTAFTPAHTSASAGAVALSLAAHPEGPSDPGLVAQVVNGNQLRAIGVGKVWVQATQAASGLYAADTAQTVLEVTPVPLTPTALTIAETALSKLTTDAPFQLTISSNSSATITVSSSNTAVATVGADGRTLTLTGTPGSATLTASQPGNATHSPASAQAQLSVKAVPAITFAAITKNVGEAPFTPVVGSNSTGTRSFTSNNPSVASIDPATGLVTIGNAGSATLTVGIAAAGDYVAGSQSTTLTVNAVDPGLALAGMTRYVGDADFTPVFQTNSAGAVSFSVTTGNGTVASIVNNQVHVIGAGTATVVASQVANGNHTADTAQATLQVLAATATITPQLSLSAMARSVGDAPFAAPVSTNSTGTRSYTSSDPTVAAVDAQGQITVLKTGSTLITVSVAATAEFRAATTSATLTVAQGAAQLIVNDLSRQVIDGAFALPVSTRSTGALSVTSSDLSVATVSGSGLNWTVTPLKTGSVTLSVNQAADSNHLAAQDSATLDLSGQLATLSWAPPSSVIKPDGSPDLLIALPAPVSNNPAGTFSYASSNTAVATVSGNTLTVRAAGTTQLTVTQSAGGGYLETSLSTGLTVTATATSTELISTGFSGGATRTYGDPPFRLRIVVTDGTGQPVDTSSGTVAYSSSDPSVIAVSGDLATIVGVGSASLAASYLPPTGSPVFASDNVTVLKGDPQVQYAATIEQVFGAGAFQPSLASRSNGAWRLRSDNPARATIGADNLTITPLVPGEVTVYVTQDETALYRAHQGSFVVHLQSGAATLSGFPDRRFTIDPLNPTVAIPAPSSPSAGAFSYTSSNTAVASVNGTTLSLLQLGSTVITATQAADLPYGEASVAATYTVDPAPNTLSLSVPGGTTWSSDTSAIRLSISSNSPAPIGLRSTNEAIATVSADGWITPRGVQGQVDIVATQAAVGVHASGSATLRLSFSADPQLHASDRQVAANAAPFVPAWTSLSSGAVTVRLTPLSGSNVASVAADGQTITVASAGTVRMDFTQAAAGGFGGDTATAVLTVGLAQPTLSGMPGLIARSFSGTPFSFDLPEVTSDSAGALSFASSNPAVATLGGATGRTVTVVGTGQALLTVSQAPQAGFGAASAQTVLSITAGTADPVTLGALTRTYGDPDFTLANTVGATAVTSYTSSDTGVAQVLADGFTVRLVGAGTTTLRAFNGATEVATGLLTVSKGVPVITFADLSLPMSTPPLVLNAGSSSTGAIGYSLPAAPTDGSTPVASLAADGRTLWVRSTGQVTLTLTQAGDANHLPATVTRTLTVTGGAPWFQLSQPLPGTVTVGQAAEFRVRTNGAPGSANLQVIDSNNTPGTLVLVRARESFDGEDVYAFTAPNVETWLVVATTPAWKVLQGGIVSRDPSSPPSTTYAWAPITLRVDETVTLPGELGNVALANGALVSASNSPTPPFALVLTGQYPGTTTAAATHASGAVFTTVTVLGKIPTLSTYPDMVLNMDQGSLPLPAPLSSNPDGAFSFQVTDPAIARVENGRLVAVAPGRTVITITQAASGLWDSTSTSANVTITPGAVFTSFGNFTRTHGDADFRLPLPAEINPALPYTVTSSQPDVGAVALDSLGGLPIVDVGNAGQAILTVQQQGATQTITATATLEVRKARPELTYLFTVRAALQQFDCDPRNVAFPRVNQGSYPANTPDAVTGASLSSRSDGVVTYRSLASELRFGVGTHMGVLERKFDTVIGPAGKTASLVIEQAPTSNFEGQTITVPDAVFLFSDDLTPPACSI